MTSAPSIPAPATEAAQLAPDVAAADADKVRAYADMGRLWLADEASTVAALIPSAAFSSTQSARAAATARELVVAMRRHPQRDLAAVLTHQLALDSSAGLALLALAEALLRVPDAPTADRLIRDKLAGVAWHRAGLSGLMATALQLASVLVALPTTARAPRELLRRLCAPPVRWATRGAMRLIGGQFVFAQTIESALARARSGAAQGERFSFDMLGEAALTAEDAERYLRSYQHAIHAVGSAFRGRGPHAGGSVSVKLSALHPRYSYGQQRRICTELIVRLRELCELAQRYDIAFAIDAEEADRLELSLELLEALLADRTLRGWSGLGIAVQAYQKRAPAVIDYLAHLARARPHRLMVRLVKGAYWDAEIKQAQMEGLPGYSVYTRKAHTDVAYLACARRLLAAREQLRPQFATHNAQTVAEILELAAADEPPRELEFQRLHGMGVALFRALRARPVGHDLALRTYAPVGPHHTLLPYLMRRLLENGAASSFVHRAARGDSSELYTSPTELATRDGGPHPHPRIPLPLDLFAPERTNSLGVELADVVERAVFERAIEDSRASLIEIAPIVAASTAPVAAGVPSGDGATAPVIEILNPADRRERIGSARYATSAVVSAAIDAAARGAPTWARCPVHQRASLLERAAELYEQHRAALVARVVREAGRTLADAVAEVREAVDYLRYYAAQSRTELAGGTHLPLGAVACISPWNFPIAIFTGQIAAALAAGNAVLAKPAEQTNATAALAVRLLLEAGIPDFALQLLPGQGERVGTQLVADPRVQGVLLTGSTEAARAIARELAQRGGVPFVAETGGQNAMIVDSTALPEQVVGDVLRSAFDSAGQRCSALRVLCVQQEIAASVLQMLEGAMRELRVGDPALIATDVGPLIDTEAQERIERHLRRMQGRIRCQSPLSGECTHGAFTPPTLIEIDSIAELEGEVFGPVLHVLRFERRALAALLDAINATGYGLTLGIASRIDATRDEIVARARVGNVYVNRNIIGAVVGVQPFGGERLSGTGPKAGGPFYLHRLLRHSSGPNWPRSAAGAPPAALATLIQWIERGSALQLGPIDREFLRLRAERYAQRSRVGARLALRGYVGESNELRLRPRGTLRAAARSPRALLEQLAAAVATGNQLAVDDAPLAEALLSELPPPLREWCRGAAAPPDAVLFDEAEAKMDPAGLDALRRELAAGDGPIVPLIVGQEGYDLDRLLLEQTVTINTAAVGGDPQLLSLGD